ncbi:MAG TPA: hypothetical protein VIJ45_01870 [Coriobacteriia bacterium]
MSDDPNSRNIFDPTELVEKAFLLGLGALDLTREKVTDLADDLIARGRITEPEAKRLAERMAATARTQRDAMMRVISEETDKVVKASGVATKRDLDELRADIADLKAAITGQASSTPPE